MKKMACGANRLSFQPPAFTWLYIGRLRQLKGWTSMPGIMVSTPRRWQKAIMKTILVIERNPAVRKTIAHMVCMAGFRAIGAAQPDGALYAIKAMQVDCMIALTKPSGQSTDSFIKVAKRIRPSLPIFLSRDIALMPAYRRLVAGHLDSPFYVCDLKTVLNDALCVASS
jgi:DNA-binding NtrC family response regulator